VERETDKSLFLFFQNKDGRLKRGLRNKLKTVQRICGKFAAYNYEGQVFCKELLEVNEKKAVIRAMQESMEAWK
jgi:hypothetical protein